MYRIALVNMPFAGLHLPSLALTQLKALVDAEMQDRVRTEVHYLNHDFGQWMGADLYREVSSMAHHPAGLGEWVFRHAAFPELEDNTEAYFLRYYPQRTPEAQAFRDQVLGLRAGVDAFLDELIERYALDQADLVGFTSMFTQNCATFAMARRLKERRPDIVVVVGGANCEAPMGQEVVRNVPAVDFVFSGPALLSFPAFVRCRLEGDARGCHRIHGVFSKRNRVLDAAAANKHDAVVTLGDAVRSFGEEMDVDTLIPLDYDPFIASLDEKGLDVEPYILFETSRGCWWGQRSHCTFCGLNGSSMSYRSMSPANAIRLISPLFRYASRSSRLESVDNIMPKEYLTDVFPYLDTPPEMGFFYEVRADLDDEAFATFAKARVKWIQPGIEALNTGTLKLMRKGNSSFQNVMFLMNCARYDISPAWNLLIGFPNEPREVYEKYLLDLPLLTHLPPPTGAYPVRFDRFSPYFVKAEEYGLKLTPLDYYTMVYPFSDDVLSRMAYYFADRNYAAQYFANVARMQGRLREKIEFWKSFWQEGRPRPELFLFERDGRPAVYDSRAGEAVEHALTEVERETLERLATPRKLAYVQGEMAHVPGYDAGAVIGGLMERGLVFHEGERYLSLVFPRGPVANLSAQAWMGAATSPAAA